MDETDGCYVYVSNFYDAAGDPGYEIQKFTCEGSFVTSWGEPGTGPGQFDRPSGVAVDSEGCVYVTDTQNNRFQKFCDLLILA